MNGLNHSVIVGKCPSCLIYEERIACLEAANAVKDAVLQKLLVVAGAYSDTMHMLLPGASTKETEVVIGQARAALSDTGKGWLPPDKAKQVHRAIDAARRHGSFEHGWVVARLDEAAAALAALEEVE